MPAVTVTTARNANRCGGASSGLGCCVVAQAELGIGTATLVATGTGVAQVAAAQDVETQGSAPAGALKRMGRGGGKMR